MSLAEKPPHLSIVIPVLNEAAGIEAALTPLQPLRFSMPIEVIVVDGGSQDDSVKIAQPLADLVLNSPAGRALQMNLGAQHASASALLFLHADTQLPKNAVEQITQALNRHAWGRFDIELSGRSGWLPMVGWMMNQRSRLTGIATGDQGMFICASTFKAVGGFPEQPLMEDIELSKRLKKLSSPACLGAKVISSGRRWDEFGAWKTILLMWRLRYRYWRGVSATQLAKEYRDAR
ncbi:TIGR04283 family arsenosugar biosynthesis glycosyltransferase [Vreelandella boliviensis]|uniref:TIGR04283 family arsenosugar biosynthesis glycosyltransferase n=1 Tax=Vreelandella boliviensis TaxID=223527 RepID=UPI001FCA99E2|nr:TIGR04283 family arsenosugar biosynthesis glycosyltransferase [Halomonas boliviensis]